MLTFSLTRPVAGHTPTATEEQQLNDRARQAGMHCEYCGYESPRNTALWRDNNPLHDSDDNLTVADPFCRAWRELDTINADRGVMAILPGLSAEDCNHLQRTLHLALHCGDGEKQQDAKALLNWLTEHQTIAQMQIGSAHPQACAQALQRTPEEAVPAVLDAWCNLRLILNLHRLPAPSPDTLTRLEATPAWWTLLYQHYLSGG